MDRLMKVFGERNTATRACLRMIEGAEGIAPIDHKHQGIPEEEIEPYNEKIKLVESVHSGPWKRVYREAIKDLRAEILGPAGAWKHSAPTYNPAYKEYAVSVLFMVRNPYSWVLSLHRRPYHSMGQRGGTLEEFLTFPWLTVGRENIGTRILNSPMELWSTKLKAYRKFRAQAKKDDVKSTQIKFEDFVAFPVSALSQALKRVDVPVEGLKALSRSTKPMGRLPEDRRSYYAKELWRTELTASDVALINSLVDWDIAEIYGYQQMDPADFPETLSSDGEGGPAPAARGGIGIVDDEAGPDEFDPVVNRGVA